MQLKTGTLVSHLISEEYGTSTYLRILMVAVDPVDKNRNVAAALTLQKMSEFIVASENFISSPSEKYFVNKEITTIQ